MEEGPSSDDDNKKDDKTPELGGKKVKSDKIWAPKLVFKSMRSGTAIYDEKDENGDSGLSVDKSESSASGERPADAQEGPRNELILAAPSSSNVDLVLNIKRPIRGPRNYRKRKAASENRGSDASSRDSDDTSTDDSGSPAPAPGPAVASDEDSRPAHDQPEDSQPVLLHSDSTSDSNEGFSSNASASSPDVPSSASSGRLDYMAGDSDSDEVETDGDPDMDADENAEYQTPSVLLKPKPQHQWFLLKELLQREMGTSIGLGRTGKTDVLFEQRYYGSLHAVYRLEQKLRLNKHRGCVNSINFHPEGHLLASGSDDLNVIVWDWAKNTALQTIKTGHKSNVFQSRFLHLNARSQLNIATCARDGQVRLLQCPPSGAGAGGTAALRRRLATHSRAAHKLHVSAAEPHLVLSAGEDGLVIQSDVRVDLPTKLFTVKDKCNAVALYSVHGHPLEPRLLVVAGRDCYVRVYDRRKAAQPFATYCPSFFTDSQLQVAASKRKNYRMMSVYVTCAVYNHDGTEILASYNDDDIYLFNTTTDVFHSESTKEGYSHRYSGHRNRDTYKGVAFYGPRSQFVVSGSDCSNLYVWDRSSEAIVQWMMGDNGGVVNCIESHPRCPVLASSGLDKDVKIWVPSSHQDAQFEGLSRVVKRNHSSQKRSPLFNDFLPPLYSAWGGRPARDAGADERSHLELDGNVCAAI